MRACEKPQAVVVHGRVSSGTSVHQQIQGHPRWFRWQSIDIYHEVGADYWNSNAGQVGGERCDRRGRTTCPSLETTTYRNKSV